MQSQHGDTNVWNVSLCAISKWRQQMWNASKSSNNKSSMETHLRTEHFVFWDDSPLSHHRWVPSYPNNIFIISPMHKANTPWVLKPLNSRILDLLHLNLSLNQSALPNSTHSSTNLKTHISTKQLSPRNSHHKLNSLLKTQFNQTRNSMSSSMYAQPNSKLNQTQNSKLSSIKLQTHNQTQNTNSNSKLPTPNSV